MKYRRLSKIELNALEKEFIDFLIVNGIIADEWMKIKQDNLSKANSIIDSFSDVVFEGAMRKIKYLDFISQKSIKSFQCLDNEIILVGMDASENSDTDFTKNIMNESLRNVSVYTSSKKYSQKREIELFKLIQSGAEVSNGEMFKNICLSL